MTLLVRRLSDLCILSVVPGFLTPWNTLPAGAGQSHFLLGCGTVMHEKEMRKKTAKSK